MSDDLRQANLSHLTLKDMNAAQRAEMRRRFEEFVGNFIKQAPAAEREEPPRVRKWAPGMKK
jgi:hypothetical protein